MDRAARHVIETSADILVIVNRRALAILPAQRPEMIPTTGMHQDALVSRFREAKETCHIPRVQLQPFELRRQLGQRSSSFQTIQMVDKHVQLVGHYAPRCDGILIGDGSPATDVVRHRSVHYYFTQEAPRAR